jgi:hypothetical protein
VFFKTFLNNTIVANSPSGGDVFPLGSTLGGGENRIEFEGSHNLIEDGSGGLPDTITGDPQLGPLQDNGGPTWTHALLPGSPARNAGSNALAVDSTGAPLTFDQRGPDFARQVGSTVDIGAFESPPLDLFAVGSGVGGGGRLRAYNSDGSLRFARRVGGPGFLPSIQVATGDVNGDGIEDVVATAGRGGPPFVWVFDGNTGALLRRFQARGDGFRLGLTLAVADFNGDGHGDIVTAPGAGGVPVVRVFDGESGDVLRAFRAYPLSFRDAVQVAAGDFTGDDVPDLVTRASGVSVQVFAGSDLSGPPALQLTNSRFRPTASMAVGDVTGDGITDLILGDGPSGNGGVLVVSGADQSVVAIRRPFGPVTGQGVRVSLADVDGDGTLDLLAALGPGRRPQVRAWSLAEGELLRFNAFELGFTGGVSLG